MSNNLLYYLKRNIINDFRSFAEDHNKTESNKLDIRAFGFPDFNLNISNKTKIGYEFSEDDYVLYSDILIKMSRFGSVAMTPQDIGSKYIEYFVKYLADSSQYMVKMSGNYLHIQVRHSHLLQETSKSWSSVGIRGSSIGMYRSSSYTIIDLGVIPIHRDLNSVDVKNMMFGRSVSNLLSAGCVTNVTTYRIPDYTYMDKIVRSVFWWINPNYKDTDVYSSQYIQYIATEFLSMYKKINNTKSVKKFNRLSYKFFNKTYSYIIKDIIMEYVNDYIESYGVKDANLILDSEVVRFRYKAQKTPFIKLSVNNLKRTETAKVNKKEVIVTLDGNDVTLVDKDGKYTEFMLDLAHRWYSGKVYKKNMLIIDNDENKTKSMDYILKTKVFNGKNYIQINTVKNYMVSPKHISKNKVKDNYKPNQLDYLSYQLLSCNREVNKKLPLSFIFDSRLDYLRYTYTRLEALFKHPLLYNMIGFGGRMRFPYNEEKIASMTAQERHVEQIALFNLEEYRNIINKMIYSFDLKPLVTYIEKIALYANKLYERENIVRDFHQFADDNGVVVSSYEDNRRNYEINELLDDYSNTSPTNMLPLNLAKDMLKEVLFVLGINKVTLD